MASVCVYMSVQVSPSEGVSPMEAEGDLTWLPPSPAVDIPDDVYLRGEQHRMLCCAVLCCAVTNWSGDTHKVVLQVSYCGSSVSVCLLSRISRSIL